MTTHLCGTDKATTPVWQGRLGPVHRPSTTVSLLDLNEDIFLELSSWLSNNDLLATIHTCRALYAMGFPQLCGRHHAIYTPEKLRSLHGALVASAWPRSFSLLRDLTLSLWLEDERKMLESHADTVLDTLRRATGLQRLSINASLLHGLHAGAAHALRNMHNLRRLDAWNVPLARSRVVLVAGAECTPEDPMLDARWSDEEAAGAWRPVRVDIRPAALEELALHDVSFAAADTCYPRLTRLTCSPCHLPRLSRLVPAFPRLEVLDLCNVLPRGPAPTQALHRCQQANRAHQRAQAAPQWPALVCLRADRPILDALALQCPVRSVMLDLHDCVAEDLADVAARLAPFAPQHLRLSELYFHPGQLQTSGLLARVQALRRLDLAVTLGYVADCGPADGLEDPHDIMSVGLEAIVRASRIRMLDCGITGDSLHPPSPEFDMHGLARRLMESSDDLCFIKLEMKTPPGFDDRLYYWSIIRDEGGPRLQDVLPDDYATMASIDGMFLPQRMPAEWFCQHYDEDPDDYFVPSD